MSAALSRLMQFPLTDSTSIQTARQKLKHSADKSVERANLGLLLADAGCGFEAAQYLRPTRSIWKTADSVDTAMTTLASQTWWNKQWKSFVKLKNSGEPQAALELLEERFVHYWDLPPLLIHLADIVGAQEQFKLSDHLYRRVLYLFERGLPKMNMTAFEYVAQSGLVRNCLAAGNPEQALNEHQQLTPNKGNVMAYELLHAELLATCERNEEAMVLLVRMRITALKDRTGYSKTMRLDFIDTSPVLSRLRTQPAWAMMLRDPETFLKQNDTDFLS